ncbi:MAG: hypothetical protein PUP91_20210 [Rhizonema sp. PD37]|nr:hypothetical protein [Rhizonema sp. PD37]
MRPDVKSAQGKRIPRAVALRKICSREYSLERVLLQSETFLAWGYERTKPEASSTPELVNFWNLPL